MAAVRGPVQSMCCDAEPCFLVKVNTHHFMGSSATQRLHFSLSSFALSFYSQMILQGRKNTETIILNQTERFSLMGIFTLLIIIIIVLSFEKYAKNAKYSYLKLTSKLFPGIISKAYPLDYPRLSESSRAYSVSVCMEFWKWHLLGISLSCLLAKTHSGSPGHQALSTVVIPGLVKSIPLIRFLGSGSIFTPSGVCAKV